MRLFRATAGGSDRFTVIVPTISSARWIADLHRYYQSIRVDPLYCIDTRSQDDTAMILASIGARTARVSSSHPRVEGLVVSFKDIVQTPWILRI